MVHMIFGGGGGGKWVSQDKPGTRRPMCNSNQPVMATKLEHERGHGSGVYPRNKKEGLTIHWPLSNEKEIGKARRRPPSQPSVNLDCGRVTSKKNTAWNNKKKGKRQRKEN